MPPKQNNSHPMDALGPDTTLDVLRGLINKQATKAGDDGTMRVYFIRPWDHAVALSSLRPPFEVGLLWNTARCLHERTHDVRFVSDGIGATETFVNANRIEMTGVTSGASIALAITYERNTDLDEGETVLVLLPAVVRFEPWKKATMVPGALSISLNPTPAAPKVTSPPTPPSATLLPISIGSVFSVENPSRIVVVYVDGSQQELSDADMLVLPSEDLARIKKATDKNFTPKVSTPLPTDPITAHPF